MRTLWQLVCVCGLIAAVALPAPLPADLICPDDGTPYPIDCPWPVCPDDGKLGQASLKLKGPGCSTTFDENPDCGTHTRWTLDKALTDSADGSADQEFTFTVTVTEQTSRLLRSSGRIVLHNEGEQVPYIESIVVNLERNAPGKAKGWGKGNKPPKPSGANWETLLTATAVRFQACADFYGLTATCFGPYSNDLGAVLRLFDPDTGDPIVFPTDIQVPPACGDVDNDSDGLKGEDPPGDANGDGNDDDDFDGLIDEDGDDRCHCATSLDFEVEFDLADHPAFDGMGCGEDGPAGVYRLEILVTFRGAGKRGNSNERVSCTADLDCDGLYLVDGEVCTTPDDLLDESEENNVRTIKHREGLDWPACEGVRCPQVFLADEGAYSLPEDCATVESDTLSEVISVDDPECPTVGEPVEHLRTVNGTVVCNDDDGECVVINWATLEGDGCEGLITGTPAGTGFTLECEAPPVWLNFPPPGSYCTQTQEDYGMACPGPPPPDPDSGDPGCVRDACFPLDFPDGLIIGDEDCDGDDCFQAEWLTSAAMEAYLPADGPAGPLDMDLCTGGAGPDPVITSSGTLGGEVAAAEMNAMFDLTYCQIRPACDPSSPLYIPGNPWCHKALLELVFSDDNAAECLDLPPLVIAKTVGQVLLICNSVVGGADCPYAFMGLTPQDCDTALAALNAAFRNCTQTSRCFSTADDPTLP